MQNYSCGWKWQRNVAVAWARPTEHLGKGTFRQWWEWRPRTSKNQLLCWGWPDPWHWVLGLWCNTGKAGQQQRTCMLTFLHSAPRTRLEGVRGTCNLSRMLQKQMLLYEGHSSAHAISECNSSQASRHEKGEGSQSPLFLFLAFFFNFSFWTERKAAACRI